MFKIYFLTFAVFAIAWTIAWFVAIRPALKRYAATADLLGRLDAFEGSAFGKLKLWLEGKKAALLLFVTSAFEVGKAAFDQATGAAVQAATAVSGLTPDAIAPLQDKSLWSAFFGDVITLHIVAALQLLAVILTVKGHVTAAKIVPAAPAG